MSASGARRRPQPRLRRRRAALSAQAARSIARARFPARARTLVGAVRNSCSSSRLTKLGSSCELLDVGRRRWKVAILRGAAAGSAWGGERCKLSGPARNPCVHAGACGYTATEARCGPRQQRSAGGEKREGALCLPAAGAARRNPGRREAAPTAGAQPAPRRAAPQLRVLARVTALNVSHDACAQSRHVPGQHRPGGWAGGRASRIDRAPLRPLTPHVALVRW